MHRSMSYELSSFFLNWYDKCFTCVEWNSAFSSIIRLSCDVRQGGVLSLYFFAVYIDEIVCKVISTGIGFYAGLVYVSNACQIMLARSLPVIPSIRK